MSTPNRKDNTGCLFKNKRRREGNGPDGKPFQDPDFTGTATVDGKEYWISGWIKTSAKQPGNRYTSFAFKPKDEDRPEVPS